METPVLQTPRLVLRPLVITDAPAIQHHFAHWDIIKNMGPAVPWPYPDNGAESFLRDSALPRAARGEAHVWAITCKGSDECMGVMEFRLEANEEGHRGFWIARHLWGQGLMREATAAVNDFVFDVLGYDDFIETNADFNAASHKLKIRSGGEMIGTKQKETATGPRTSEIWRITRDGWKAVKAAG